MPDTAARLRDLPAVDHLLNSEEGLTLRHTYGHALAVEGLRHALDAVRATVRDGGLATLPGDQSLVRQAGTYLADVLAPTLYPVVNATGVIIHTNLGRAPLSTAAQDAIQQAASSYTNLEYDVAHGKRGSRAVHAEALITRLTGAEAALVVNNNAAAVLLLLTALAKDRQVIISRGQLVEIGGGFRIPDVMAHSGAHLVEVGTTNRTHLRDYEQALDAEHTALILRAHTSNYKIVGFTTEPSIRELAQLGQAHGVLVGDDLGSGSLLDTADFGMAHEPTPQDSVQAGVDVVAFSGDKLLGGPQAGILAGKAAVIERLKRHPLARAVRADKLCLAALGATLAHYARGEALTEIPIWRMIAAPVDVVRQQAEGWLAEVSGLQGAIIEGHSTVGGGSLPGETLPTALLALTVPSAEQAAASLRAHNPPVVARIEDGRLLLDPRTVPHEQNAAVVAALKNLSAS